VDPSPLSSVAALQPYIHQALRAWSDVQSTPANLLAFLLVVREERRTITPEHNPVTLRHATNAVLLRGIQLLRLRNPRHAEILVEHFLNDDAIKNIAARKGLNDDTIHRLQYHAITDLSEIILELENDLRSTRALALEALLPAASFDVELIGCRETLDHLGHELLAVRGPWLVNIVGPGGIGKSALAHALARQLLRAFTFERVIWIDAGPETLGVSAGKTELVYREILRQLEQKLFPGTGTVHGQTDQARKALKTAPHLIIMDDLEIETDSPVLLERLRDLCDPTKILITSRARPPGLAGVYLHLHDELPLAAAETLIREFARTKNAGNLAAAPAEDIAAIYQAAGGNPRALKLIVDLTATWSLPQILRDLTTSPHGKIEELYGRHFKRAWLALQPASRQLLRAMPQTGGAGITQGDLHQLSGLTEPDFHLAVSELVARSLLSARGTLHEIHYSTHGLTRAFLQTGMEF